MFLIDKEFTFEASHRLMNHEGKCNRLHGHSWKLTVRMAGNKLQEIGSETAMLVDYGNISSVVKEYVNAKLDHHHLNETFNTNNPTSEYIAEKIYWDLKGMLSRSKKINSLVKLHAVIIEETCTSACCFMEGSCYE